MPETRVVLGIDPGTATLGYGVVRVERGSLHHEGSGALRTPQGLALPLRLLQLFDALEEIVAQHRPTDMAVEQLFFSRNVSTAIAVGEARGVVLLVAARAGLVASEYTPMQVKQAVAGQGRADKRKVQEMVRLILRLAQLPEPDDAADALAIAICHANVSAFQQRMPGVEA